MKHLILNLFNKVRENIFLLTLFAFFIVVLAVNIRINLFRYDNFDLGKFDLGNMNQMIYNTINGRFMYLTDYFGTNLPRWSMSHVDPILLIFIPIFIIFPHPMTIVYSQILLVLGSCFIVYKIAKLHLKSNFAAAILGASYLLYPAVGFITAWTGYHGVSAVIPFFFLAFYVFEKMYKEDDFTTKGIITFWILLILTMTGKEQIPLYIIFYGIFILIFRNKKLLNINLKKSTISQNISDFLSKALKLKITKLALSMVAVGIVWFVTCFFVIIPMYAHYRVDGFNEFAMSLNIDPTNTRDVDLDNYFLARYEAFGDTYTEVIFGMLFNPQEVVRIFFGGDRVDNLNKTFGPLAYLPLAYPVITIIALPDLAINYLTSADGVGTSEITNHRISMIIPVLFISTIYAIQYLSNLFFALIQFFSKKYEPLKIVVKNKTMYLNIFISAFSLLVLFTNIHMTFYSNNPVFLWLEQAIQKRVFAKTADSDINLSKLEIGDVVSLSELENKDRECARKIVNLIPDNVSVSGPDYLGAHLSLRETYAIFPALYNKADYVIVDVFSRKLLTILDVDVDLSRDVIEKMIKSDEYKMITGCGNLFVFKNVGEHEKDSLLPMQEKFDYEETVDLELFKSLYIVDYNLPENIKVGESKDSYITYTKRDDDSIGDYIMFMSLINKETREVYQMANLPSFSIIKPEDWVEDRFYTEKLQITIPTFLEKGDYMFFVGMGNNIRTRSIYLGDILVD